MCVLTSTVRKQAPSPSYCLGFQSGTLPLHPPPMWMDALLFDLIFLRSQCLCWCFDMPLPSPLPCGCPIHPVWTLILSCWTSLHWSHMVTLLTPARASTPHSRVSLYLNTLFTLLGCDTHVPPWALFSFPLCFSIPGLAALCVNVLTLLEFWLPVPDGFPWVVAFRIHWDLTLNFQAIPQPDRLHPACVLTSLVRSLLCGNISSSCPGSALYTGHLSCPAQFRTKFSVGAEEKLGNGRLLNIYF